MDRVYAANSSRVTCGYRVRIDGIIWLENVERKIWEKHRVQPDEVEAVLESDPHVRFVERGFRQGEDIYSALGRHPADDT